MIPSPVSHIIFTIGRFQLRWYSLTMLLAVLSALFISARRAVKRGVKEDHIYDMGLFAIISGFIGARLFHVLYEYQYYFSHLNEIPKVWEGGLAIHGALVFATLAVFFYCRYHKLSFWKIVDIVTRGVLVAQIVGRFGNYFNQEAFGTPTSLPWGISIKESLRPEVYKAFESFHPTFAYEALWNGLVLILILQLEKRLKLKSGSVFAIYLIAYGIGRALVEFIRTDATFLGPLRFVHWISILLIILGTLLLWHLKKTK